MDKSDCEEYTKYINNHSDSIIEHSLIWRDTIEKSFGFKSCHVICKNNGIICGVLPLFKSKSIFGKKLVSTPYAIYTGPIANNDEIRQGLVNFSIDIAIKENFNFLEIRQINESLYKNLKLNKKLFNFSLKLDSDYENIWKKLPKGSIRWGIKKSINCGLKFEVGRSPKDFDNFYKLFLLTRKFRGVPSYPYNYFKNIMDKFNFKIYTTKLEGKPIASIFLIYYKKEVRYAFAGALHDKEMMQLQPYHLIIWEAIKDACKDGYTTFNFGGATLNTNEGGLYDFKRKWADNIIEIPYYYFLNKSSNFPIEENKLIFVLASEVWKLLPVNIIKLLSPMVIKQFI